MSFPPESLSVAAEGGMRLQALVLVCELTG